MLNKIVSAFAVLLLISVALVVITFAMVNICVQSHVEMWLDLSVFALKSLAVSVIGFILFATIKIVADIKNRK